VLLLSEEQRHRDILLALHYLGAQKSLLTLTNLMRFFESGERGAEKGFLESKTKEEKSVLAL